MIDEPKKDVEIDFDELYKKMATADLSKMAAELKTKRTEMEQKINNLSPFLNEDSIKMIINYAVLLNSFHNKDANSPPTKKELVEHLVAATYAVAFATAQGDDVAKTLPLMALSGANIGLAEQIIKEYYIVLGNNQKES
jgi:hypothetical protein